MGWEQEKLYIRVFLTEVRDKVYKKAKYHGVLQENPDAIESAAVKIAKALDQLGIQFSQWPRHSIKILNRSIILDIFLQKKHTEDPLEASYIILEACSEFPPYRVTKVVPNEDFDKLRFVYPLCAQVLTFCNTRKAQSLLRSDEYKETVNFFYEKGRGEETKERIRVLLVGKKKEKKYFKSPPPTSPE